MDLIDGIENYTIDVIAIAVRSLRCEICGVLECRPRVVRYSVLVGDEFFAKKFIE